MFDESMYPYPRNDIEFERPLAEDETYLRALAKATAILEVRREAALDADREDILKDLPHTD